MGGIPTIPKWFAYDCVSTSMLILTVESELPVHWIRWQNPSFTETSFLSVGILNSVGISNGKWNIALPNCNLPDIPLFWMSHHNSPWKGRPFGDSMDWFKGKVTEIYIYTHGYMIIWLFLWFNMWKIWENQWFPNGFRWRFSLKPIHWGMIWMNSHESSPYSLGEIWSLGGICGYHCYHKKKRTMKPQMTAISQSPQNL